MKGEELSVCLDCTAGYYCPGTGNVDPIVCDKGNYSDTGHYEFSIFSVNMQHNFTIYFLNTRGETDLKIYNSMEFKINEIFI